MSEEADNVNREGVRVRLVKHYDGLRMVLEDGTLLNNVFVKESRMINGVFAVNADIIGIRMGDAVNWKQER